MSSSKMTLTASALPFIPQEILVKILSKLPAKSLVRFKCVSKLFCSLVVDHPFADLHRNWSLTLPSRMSILISFPILRARNTDWYYTINYSEEKQGKLQANRLQYIDGNLFPTVYYLSSSLDGLICFCRYSQPGDDLAIHNLSTRQHISLPSSCPRLCPDSMSRIDAFGFLGFDSVSRRYKVLKSVHFTNRSNGNHSVKHWIFTMGVDKSWREIYSSPSYHPYNRFNSHFYFHTSVHIDGIIYSFNFLNKGKDYPRGEIVAFDFRAENFQAIPPPPTNMMPRLVEVNRRLAIVDLISDFSDQNFSMEIWTLEGSMVWKKQYLIPIPIPLEDSKSDWFNKRNFFFATNRFGEIAVLVMLSRSVSILLFYNFRKESWRKFDICELPLPQSLPWSVNMNFILDNVF